MQKKKRKKGLTVKCSVVKIATLCLQKEIKTKEIKSVPKDIIKLIDESKKFKNNDEKTYSPERVIKLKSLLSSFVSLHNIEASPELKEFVSLIDTAQKTYSEASAYFSEAFDEIYTMLEKYPYREFEKEKIYFVDKDGRDKLNQYRRILEKLISTKTEQRNIRFNKIVNFFNPDNIATYYSIKYVQKYQYISKKESIEKYLPVHYEVMKNKLNKEFRELFETHKFNTTNKKILEDKRDAQLKTMKEEYNYLMQCIRDEIDIDIKILSYEHAPMYPEINFRGLVDKKPYTRSVHLRSEVINVLWYKPVQLKSNNTIANILENYSHAFGDVYFLQKDSTNI